MLPRGGGRRSLAELADTWVSDGILTDFKARAPRVKHCFVEVAKQKRQRQSMIQGRCAGSTR